MPQINVLKPFRFCYLKNPDDKLTSERLFGVGFHEIAEDDPMLQHQWITRDCADGCIESTEQREVRLKEAQRLQREREAIEAQAQAAAQAAYERATKKEGAKKAVDAAALEKELNTPVSELRARGQVSSSPGVVAPGGDDLNKPVSQLREEQGLPPVKEVQQNNGPKKQRMATG